MLFETYSFWDKLIDNEKPIILYGTGNGADKIIDIFESKNIKLSGIFASDGFVRDRYFRGIKVQSYSEIIKEYGNDITIILAFGSNVPEVIDRIKELDSNHELIIPDTPLYGGDLFDFNYFKNQYDQIEELYNILADEYSKKVLVNLINFRLTGKYKYLDCGEDFNTSLKNIFSYKKIKYIIDGGAYKGDTCQSFIESLNPEIIYAVEADKKTFEKLEIFSINHVGKIIPYNFSLSDHWGYTEYSSSGSRGSGISGSNKRAKTVLINNNTIDAVFGDRKIDLIKLDVEGNEEIALSGAKELIQEQKPDIIVSLYHKTNDFITLSKLIHQNLPSHKLLLRKVNCIPFWDLNLFAVK